MLKVGDRVGKLTLLERKRENNRTYFLCKCDCGTEKWIRADCLGPTISCGCYNKEKNLYKEKNLIGEKFGRLTVIEKTEKRTENGVIIWLCKCSCGNYKEVSGRDLKDGFVSSCGCLATERSKRNIQKAIKKHLDSHIVEGTNLQTITREKPLSNNTSGVTGVRWDKSRQKWYAEIEFQGKKHYLGRYTNKEDAIKARKEAEEKYFKKFLEEFDNEK